jgi:uncharacterized membrane protein
MQAAFSLALLWATFAGSHMILSSARLRPRLRARLGEQGFRGLYSLIALAIFVPLVGVYWGNRHAGPLLWTTIGPPAVATALNHVLMALALVLLASSLLPASAAPSAMQAQPEGIARVRGMTRITRHPTLVAFALFGIAHLLVNGNLADVVFFGGFPLFTWIGARHQDERMARDRPGYRNVIAHTSIVPFGAILAGRQSLVPRELPLPGIVVGLGLATVLRIFHSTLFGP